MEKLRINREIRASQVRVIAPEGEQLGIMPLEDALKKAQDMELDLVEVAPQGNPPVCRIMDYGKYLYREKKKDQQGRRKSHAHEIKEIQIGPRIAEHDLNIKLAAARRFLEEGHRVVFNMKFKGREMTHMDLGIQILNTAASRLGDAGKIERPPFREGRNLSLCMAPRPQVSEKAKAEGPKPATPAGAARSAGDAPAKGGSPAGLRASGGSGVAGPSPGGAGATDLSPAGPDTRPPRSG
ncbi:MAG: translation initiation factor IF-3 [Planctomycetota bacterium]|nr:translation initiation factor IF-3 [Planctomycetota bacterium]